MAAPDPRIGVDVGGSGIKGAVVDLSTGELVGERVRIPTPESFGLDEVVATAPSAGDRGRPRLWIDRVFAAKGSGTVVTGTLVDGAIAVDDQVLIEPGSRPARVRAVQTAGRAVERIGPGHRGHCWKTRGPAKPGCRGANP